MRVLCSTTAGEGHFGPLRALGQACAAAGHEVLVAAPASFAGAVARAGLEHAPFGDPSPSALTAVFARLPELAPAVANAMVMREVFGRLDAQAALPGLRQVVANWRPDVILREPAELGSLAAAEAATVPHAEVAVGVGALMEWAWPLLTAPLSELDELHGLEPGRLLRAAQTSAVFTVVPARMDEASKPARSLGNSRLAIRYRFVASRPSGRLPPTWGDPGAPLVYVTFGTVAAGVGRMGELFAGALRALADLPLRVLLTTGYAGEIPSAIPPNAHVEKFWPQDHVMPHAALVVGHGGFGTTLTALTAGVAQVVLPLFTTDQYLNADAVAALRAGIRLPGGPAGVDALASAVQAALNDPDIRAGAAAVAAEIAALPDALAVVEHIERIASRGTGNP